MTNYLRREAAVDWYAQHLTGVAYDSGGDRLTDPPENHPTDCSGSVWRALRHGGGLWLPPVLSWTMARAWEPTHPISISAALNRRGSILYMGANGGKDGFGDDGHVCFTDGDGVHVWETPSAGHKAGKSVGTGREWTGASGFDGDDDVIFSTGGSGPAPPQPPIPNFAAIAKYLRAVAAQSLADEVAAKVVLVMGSRGQSVKDLQNALNLAVDGGLAVDGVFGPGTRSVTLLFQQRFFVGQPWQQDGQAGPTTMAGLQYYLALRNQ